MRSRASLPTQRSQQEAEYASLPGEQESTADCQRVQRHCVWWPVPAKLVSSPVCCAHKPGFVQLRPAPGVALAFFRWGELSSTSLRERRANRQVLLNETSAERRLGHALTFSARIAPLMPSETKGKLFSYVSHGYLCRDNKAAHSSPLQLVETRICTTFQEQSSFIYCLQSAVTSRCSLHGLSQHKGAPSTL